MSKIRELEERMKELEARRVTGDWKSVVATLIIVPLTVWWLYHSVVSWGLFEIFSLEIEKVTFAHLAVIPHFFFNYALISLSVICVVALLKGGFDKLKSIDDDGVVYGVVVGAICGVVAGMIGGVVDGVVVGVIFGVVDGAIFGVVVGVVGGVVVGVVGGVISAIEEFGEER